MIADCGWQLRAGGMGRPFALDYGAVLAVAEARGADKALIADVLPIVERAVIANLAGEGEGDGE
ncbi:hypothetical protein TS85_11415 [Sphingomonas hengshuiensis]|uniref:Uncharacterized protein n=2 Tax=Sphingomonas hengshuiensis TaxID=1609977 RepID=A0A7U4LFG9_9SPHN|nr:hypothetical protein TS85_11415 [Sphingomonas hengshuiensis]